MPDSPLHNVAALYRRISQSGRAKRQDTIIGVTAMQQQPPRDKKRCVQADAPKGCA